MTFCFDKTVLFWPKSTKRLARSYNLSLFFSSLNFCQIHEHRDTEETHIILKVFLPQQNLLPQKSFPVNEAIHWFEIIGTLWPRNKSLRKESFPNKGIYIVWETVRCGQDAQRVSPTELHLHLKP